MPEIITKSVLTGDGITASYTIPFDYLSRSHVHITVDGEAEEYGSDAKLFLKMAEAYIAAASTVITNSEGSDVDLIHEVDEAC